MDERITIPTSEDRATSPGHEVRSRGVWWLVWVVIVLLGLIGGVAAWPNSPAEVSLEGELSAPDAAGLPEPEAVAIEFPGSGGVVAIASMDQDLVAVVSGNWGSTIWHLDSRDDVWRIADFFPGLSLVDAVTTDGELLVVGFETFGAGSVVLTGVPGSMRQLDLDIVDRFIPTRVRVGAAGTFVFTAVGGRSATFLGGPVVWIEDANVSALDTGSRSAGIDDIAEHEGELLAFGSDDGAPAMWAISASGELQPRVLELDLGSARVAAAAVAPSGRLIGLVVGRLGQTLISTAVVELETPHAVLADPTVGVWNELVELPDGLVALPADGPVIYRTIDGVEWAYERAALGPSDDLALEDVAVLASGAEVFAGAAVDRHGGRTPSLSTNARLAAEFELREGGWRLIESYDDTGIVHVGRLHVGIDGGVVVARKGFGADWFQPVFADVDSVGGRVGLFELDHGYLLTATEPFEGLWYSTEGRAWQLIERGSLRVAAGSGDEALVVADGRMSRITSTGVNRVDTDENPASFLRSSFGWVDGVGYVVELADGTLRASPDGSSWSDLDIDGDAGASLVVGGRLAVSQGSTWFVVDPSSGALLPVTLPAGTSRGSLHQVRRDVALVRDGARLWLSEDLETWFDASLGIWNGTDGTLIDAWITSDGVIGVIGSGDETGVYRREP